MNRSTSSPWLWIGLLAAIGAIVLLLPSDPEPYDLDSSHPSGYLALRYVVEEHGGDLARVDAGAIDSSAVAAYPSVYVPVAENASKAVLAGFESYVAAGGNLVLGTATDGLGPAQQVDFFEEISFDSFIVSARPSSCDIAELEDLESIDIAIDVADVSVGDRRSCFGDGEFAFVVQEDIGQGTLTVLGSPALVTNESLGAPMPDDEDLGGTPPVPDNAMLVSRLIAPAPGHDVAVVTGGLSTARLAQGESVTDFISPGVKLGLMQLVVAIVLYSWFRARRYADLVSETDPVEVNASELTRAIGSLLERQGDAERGGKALRFQAHKELCRALGLAPDTPVSTVAQLVSQRCGFDHDRVLAALSTAPIDDDSDLVSVSQEIDLIRREATK